MFVDLGPVYALAVLIAGLSIVTRVVSHALRRSELGSASSRLAKMEDRIQKIEEATSGLVAEFAAVRERERFMTQLVESRVRKDARVAQQTPASGPIAADTTNPYVVQTVAAVRRKTEA
jgi:hypothetical protein